MDPLHVKHSPYLGMNNNPILFTDPDGRNPLIFIGIGAAIGTFGGAMYAQSQGYTYSDPEYKRYMAAGFILGGAAGAGAYYFSPAAKGAAGKASAAPITLGHKSL